MKTYEEKLFVDKNLHEDKSKKIIHWSFENTNEYIDIASKESNTYLSSSRVTGSERKEWTGTKDIEEAIELARFGWKDGLTAAKNIEKDFKISFDDILPKQDLSKNIISSQEGEIFNADKFYSGDPEHMDKFKDNEESKVTRGNRFQRLVVNGSIHCGITKETMFNAGVIYERLINALELHGFSVELLLRFCLTTTYSSGVDSVIDILIKQFEETSDIDKIIFQIAHASNLRRLGFSIVEKFPKDLQQKLGYHYGFPIEYNNDLRLIYGDDGTIFLPSINTNLSKTEILNIVREKVNDKFNPKEDSFSA